MKESKGIIGSSVAAVLSIVAAGSCCLPFGALLASGSMAAAGEWISPLRPYLYVVSAACLGWAIWRMVYAPRCQRRGPVQMAVVAIASIVVGAMFLLPQQVANFLANWVTVK